jgi:putative transposase
MPKFAPPRSDKLTDRGTLDFTIGVLEQYFDLSANGYLCQTPDLWRVLVSAAARRTYIETICNDLQDAPDSNTVRGYLKEQLTPDCMRALQRDCNRALASQLPTWLRDHPKDVAIDLHDEPYYGKDDNPEDPNCWICRGEARDGTTRFYRCATAYVMQRDVRFTLAVEFVHPDTDLVQILKRLIRRVKALKIRVRRYLLDKGFCGIPVMRELQAELDMSAIVAVTIRGKTGGTRALCQGRSSYHTDYTFRSAENGELTVPLAVVRTIRKRRDGTLKVEWLIYALLNVTDVPIRRVRKLYRRRFGIESSYRLLEQIRGHTTARNVALRFLWMGIALLIGNLWIALHWLYLRRRGSGPRRVARQHFTLSQLAQFLRRAVEAMYGVISTIDPPDVKPAVL